MLCHREDKANQKAKIKKQTIHWIIDFCLLLFDFAYPFAFALRHVELLTLVDPIRC